MMQFVNRHIERVGLQMSVCCLVVVCVLVTYHAESQTLRREWFADPPTQYKPKTWMHAMSGNMSKAGITKDLEAMRDAGLGGLLLFNIAQGIPNGTVEYASAEHIDMLAFAAKEAARLGLAFGVHNCDGWSSSGGPWVAPEDAMKMVVHSELLVKGDKNLNIQLPSPTVREGFYRDIVTIAYPSLKAETEFAGKPLVTSSAMDFNVAIATDGSSDATVPLKRNNAKEIFLQFDFGKAQAIRTATCVTSDRDVTIDLYASADGSQFTMLRKLDKVRTGKGEWINYDNIEAAPFRYYRMVFSDEANIKEASLSPVESIQNLYGRIAMARTEIGDFKPIGTSAADMVIDPSAIINISKNVDSKGRFTGSLPAGNWTIMRFGYTATGAFNHPASDAGRGLEVDKLSRAAFKKHYDAFVKKVVIASDKLQKHGLQYAEIDSYEMGGQNWTEGFGELFQKRFGYSPYKFMPLLAGRFVGSAAISEAVLQDWRTLTSDLMTENYYKYFQELCNADGLKTYVENYGFGPLNELEVGSTADMPMGEFWMRRPITQVAAPISAAHIYGRNVISAESFTSTYEINWKGHPAMAKSSGDKAWTLGINEFMFHRFAHQTNTHVAPGMTMNRWGFHMDRTQTWWYDAGAAWFKYIARGSYLLQQGFPVADLLVFVGDGSPNGTVGKSQMKPRLPHSFTYDNVNADVLMNRVSMVNGNATLPEGGSYKALILHNSYYMRISLLQQLAELSNQGLIIIGSRPKALLGYGHSASDSATFKKLVESIWSKSNVYEEYDFENIFAKERIFADAEVIDRTDIDIAHRRTTNEDIYFTYNPDSVATKFIYKLKSNGKSPEIWDALTGSIVSCAQFEERNGFIYLPVYLQPEQSVFVVLGSQKLPTAHIVDADAHPNVFFRYNNQGKLTAVVDQRGNYSFSSTDGKVSFNVNTLAPININPRWQVAFNKEDGYGGVVAFDKLYDWKDHPLDSIRYFSGTADYTAKFAMPEGSLSANKIWQIDLGSVSIAATVLINDVNLGVVFMSPYTLDVTKALRPGENTIKISVTNLWSNRLIGEERYPLQDGGYKLEGQFPKGRMPEWYTSNSPMPPGPRTTFTTAPFYKKTDALQPSGLLGPVKLIPSLIMTLE